MDFSQIKQLVKRNGDRVILVENDQPEIVVMSFQEYEKMAQNGWSAQDDAKHPASNLSSAEKTAFADDFSSIFDDARESGGPFGPLPFDRMSASNQRPPSSAPVRIEDLTLDDLPLESPLP